MHMRACSKMTRYRHVSPVDKKNGTHQDAVSISHGLTEHSAPAGPAVRTSARSTVAPAPTAAASTATTS